MSQLSNKRKASLCPFLSFSRAHEIVVLIFLEKKKVPPWMTREGSGFAVAGQNGRREVAVAQSVSQRMDPVTCHVG